MEMKCAILSTFEEIVQATVDLRLIIANSQLQRLPVCWLGKNKLIPEKLAGNILIQLLMRLFLPFAQWRFPVECLL